jgi:predicted Ser/Thr protein kinase
MPETAEVLVEPRPSCWAKRPRIEIAVVKTEPGDENNLDISSLVGKLDIRKL